MRVSLFTVQASIIALASHVFAQNDVDPTTDENLLQFKSRPDLSPPKLFVNETSDAVTPGYIFMAPYQSVQNSAAIYETDGTLIWFGNGLTGAGNVHDFKPCRYNGTDHLCFFAGQQFKGYARGQAMILDDKLQQVKTVSSQNARAALDQHEFNVIGDSALFAIYQPMAWDLSDYNISQGQGWIQNSVFQDVNLVTGELEFEWSSIEHVALAEGYVTPNQSEVSGTGFGASSPWDYFHINSVDKSESGDYLISARHPSTLYKINGQTGDIIWRCGGKLSDFEAVNGLNWSYQHDARWLSQNASTEIISFFDNASNGFNQSAENSFGYIIKINHHAQPPSVEAVRTYPAPADLPISSSQGDTQILNPGDWENSNAFIGWGSQPYVTEHDSTGEIIYRANVAADGIMNYRAFKGNITLNPADSPALYTYAADRDTSTTFYMSWNGATELREWRVYGRSACDNDWALLGNVPKADFETSYTAQGFQEFGMVEAVNADGTGLRNSTIRGVKTFVPRLSMGCGDDGCPVATEYSQGAGQQALAETQSGCAAIQLTTSNSTQTESSDAMKLSDRSSSLAMAAVILGLVMLF